MATIIKNTASNVSPTEALGRKTSPGSDWIYVVQTGIGGTIDGGGGTDHLVLDFGTTPHNFVLATDFASLHWDRDRFARYQGERHTYR
jgi:hypothetical protein